MTKVKAKHQRLVLIALAMTALVGAALLAAWALRNQASYFYVPSELRTHPPAPDREVRLGGMVEKGSILTQADHISIVFSVADGTAQVPVRFTGIAPDLFQEGSGVVAEGHMGRDGMFVAERLLAKHDEKYVPREMKDMTTAQAKQVVSETK
jgi:cytochrome c-type biogenesis protein CcmE